MTSDLKKYKLKDVCSKITDGSHYSPKPQDNGYPMLSVKDMLEYCFDYSNCKYISDDDYIKMEKSGCVPQKDDILVAKDGSYLKQIFICKETKKEAILSSIAIFRPNPNIIIPKYLCYLLKSPKIYNHISLNCVSGSALPRIVLKDFKTVDVEVPPLETQRKIARVLGAIDDKIELNNSINKNLEQQMDLLYTNMFIDDTNFVELGSVIETTSGGTPSRKNLNFYKNGTINWIKSKELLGTYIIKTEEYITDEAVKKSSAKILPKQSVLVAMYGATVGAYGIISKEMTCNQAICALIQNERYPYPYIFETIKFAKNTLVNMAVGSAQQNISQILIKQLPVHSNLDKIKKYCNIAELLLCKILNIQEENSCLTQLRDTLLPKLMNGEIDVDKLEA